MIGTGDFFSPLIHEQALVREHFDFKGYFVLHAVINLCQSLQVAVNEADIILFMFDCREGITSRDIEVAKILKRNAKDKHIILVANKADNPTLCYEIEERNNSGSNGNFLIPCHDRNSCP